MPTQTSKNQNDTNNIAEGTYLDNFATPAVKTQPIIKSEETIVINDGKTIKRIYLNKIEHGKIAASICNELCRQDYTQ